MKRALVVAAHGSHYHAGTALPAWACVDKIRQLGLFDEVTAAFWKEQPSFSTVLDGLTSEHVTVVPLFSSEGYFSQSVLPAELQPREGQTVKITDAVGSSHFFVEVVAARIRAALLKADFLPSETAVVIVGHGTPRHAESSRTTEFQAAQLAQNFAEVHTAYLDDSPYIADIYLRVTTPNLVVVPFFIAEGLHTQQDIPQALGLSDPFYVPQMIQNRRVLYTPPVGLEENLYQVVLNLSVFFALTPDPSPIKGEGLILPDTIKGIGGEGWGSKTPSIGQISLLHPDYLCHVDDIHRTDLESLESPEAVRAKLRLTDTGQFRPLATCRDLPHGWKIPTPDAAHREAALQMIYPGVWKVERLRSPREVGLRQKGKYRPVADLSPEKIDAVVQKVCSSCIRFPSWFHNNVEPVPGCIEPCSVWMEEAI